MLARLPHISLWLPIFHLGDEHCLPQVLDLLSSKYTHSTRDEWAEHCAATRVHMDGVAARTDTTVAVGSLVEYHRPPWHEPDAPTTLEVTPCRICILIPAYPIPSQPSPCHLGLPHAIPA